MKKFGDLLKKNKAFYLAYDQGIEHGSSDFNDENADPEKIIKIAEKGKFNGLILQKGIAEKYKSEINKTKIPLIIKLNGKTNLYNGEPISRQICTVAEATHLGAKAVGYTIYIGSEFENIMLSEFSNIIRATRKKKIPAIAWIYPRGKSIKNKNKIELMHYSARVGLEIGADMVKLNYHGSLKDLKKTVQIAGKTKILVAGGHKASENEVIKTAKEIKNSNACGFAIGRNIWQRKDPTKIANKIRRVLFNDNI